jgi:hypothetical protein
MAPAGKGFVRADGFGQLLPYVRPGFAVSMTAGLDEVRGLDPNQNRALGPLHTTWVVPILGSTVVITP